MELKKLAPRLKVGQRIKLTEDGPIMTVEAVTYTAAYVRSEATQHKVVYDRDANSPTYGEVKAEFDSQSSKVLAISPTSFVIQVDKDEA